MITQPPYATITSCDKIFGDLNIGDGLVCQVADNNINGVENFGIQWTDSDKDHCLKNADVKAFFF